MASLRKMNGLRLYGRYIRLHFLSGLQYKGWPLLFLHTIVVVVTDPIGTLFLSAGSAPSAPGRWSGFC